MEFNSTAGGQITSKFGEAGQTPKKVRKPKKDQTRELWVAIALDESGSMGSLQEQVINGYNEFMADRVKDSEIRPVRIWVNKFSTKATTIVDGLKAENVEKLTKESYSPNGWTALLDSVGELIHLMSTRIKETNENPEITMLIMTDGQENKSTEYKKGQIKEMVTAKEKEGWNIVYFGSDINTFSDAASLGMTQTMFADTTAVGHNALGVTLAANSRAIKRQALGKGYEMPTDLNT